jgi:hypothetical protein
MINHLIAGTAAGIAQIVVGHPFDTIKVAFFLLCADPLPRLRTCLRYGTRAERHASTAGDALASAAMIEGVSPKTPNDRE